MSAANLEELPLVQTTAPERISLVVSDDPSDRDQPFPHRHQEMCWSHDEPLSTCVPYVRADLAMRNSTNGVVMTDNARDPGLAAPVRGRQVPPLGPQEIDRLIATQERDGSMPFTLADEPSWHRRHDDVCPIKRAFWTGATWGWCVGVVMTAAAVAWRLAGH